MTEEGKGSGAGGDGLGELPVPAFAFFVGGDLEGFLGPLDGGPGYGSGLGLLVEGGGVGIGFVADAEGAVLEGFDQDFAGVVVLVGSGAAGLGVGQEVQVLGVGEMGDLGVVLGQSGGEGEQRVGAASGQGRGRVFGWRSSW